MVGATIVTDLKLSEYPPRVRALGRSVLRFAFYYWGLLLITEIANHLFLGQWDSDAGTKWGSLLNSAMINMPVLDALAVVPFGLALWLRTRWASRGGPKASSIGERLAVFLPALLAEVLSVCGVVFAGYGVSTVVTTLWAIVVILGPGIVVVSWPASDRV